MRCFLSVLLPLLLLLPATGCGCCNGHCRVHDKALDRSPKTWVWYRNGCEVCTPTFDNRTSEPRTLYPPCFKLHFAVLAQIWDQSDSCVLRSESVLWGPSWDLNFWSSAQRHSYGEHWVRNQDSYYGLFRTLLRTSIATSGLNCVDLRKSNMPHIPTLASEQTQSPNIQTFSNEMLQPSASPNRPRNTEKLTTEGRLTAASQALWKPAGNLGWAQGLAIPKFIRTHIDI